jgi:hypothetical protein
MTIIYHCPKKEHGRFISPNCPICGKETKLYNHRTKLKIILNPILRKLFNLHIVSIFENGKFVK